MSCGQTNHAVGGVTQNVVYILVCGSHRSYIMMSARTRSASMVPICRVQHNEDSEAVLDIINKSSLTLRRAAIA